VNLLIFALAFCLAGCSTTSQMHDKKRVGPGMSEDAQDLRAGGYVN